MVVVYYCCNLRGHRRRKILATGMGTVTNYKVMSEHFKVSRGNLALELHDSNIMLIKDFSVCWTAFFTEFESFSHFCKICVLCVP